jgi:HEAT repeat protein
MQVLLQPLDLWQYWWEFNRDPFLNLKAKVYARSVATRSDDFFLGRNRREDARDTDRPSRDEIERTVVPALLEVLRTEKNREVLDSSMIALAKIGGNPSFVDAIAPFLRHDNQTLVETASIALGILAHPDAFSPLESLALDTPEGRRLVGRQEVPFRVRAFATYGLGLLAAARRDTRSSVAGTLVRVLESERSAYKDVSVAASIALGLFEDPSDRAIFALQRVFEDRSNHPLVRAHAPVSIAKSLRKGEATPDVADRFAESFASALAQGEKDESVRGSCVIALGLLADPTRPRYGEVVRALARALHEGSRDMERNFAAIALAEAGGPEAAAALLRARARGRSTLRPRAGIGLGVLCHRARASSAVFPEWGTILERLHEALLEAGNPEDAAAYAIALGLAGDPSSFDPIVSRMRRISEEDSRGYFCTALGLLGDGRARPLLHGEVKDTLRKPHLLRQAAIGLGLLSDHEAVPELLELLRDADTLAVQSAVATALGFIGDARSIPDLLALLRSREHTEFARGFAAVALGMIGDKEDLPWNSKIAVSTNYRALVRTLVGSPMAPGILDIL